MENNKNMTAVEWIEVELKNWLEDAVCLPDYIFEEAKQMEKEQIIDAYNKNLTGFDKLEQEEMGLNWAEDFYNETYGKENSN